jgi:hypothetical protein
VDENLMVKDQLQFIKNNWFRKTTKRPQGLITHHADCQIYRSLGIYKYAFCDCGLHYNLNHLEGFLYEKLYPQYHEEKIREEGQIIYVKPTKKQMDEFYEKMRCDFDLCPMTNEELFEQDEEEWQLIEEIFGLEYTIYLKENL